MTRSASPRALRASQTPRRLHLLPPPFAVYRWDNAPVRSAQCHATQGGTCLAPHTICPCATVKVALVPRLPVILDGNLLEVHDYSLVGHALSHVARATPPVLHPLRYYRRCLLYDELITYCNEDCPCVFLI